ncbi:enoyl-CoA hydratase/isomerase family protein [Pseudarthrobacter sp. NIBRBAC000502772]|uniref:enoyl-CoA hydratase/isomerase family protein n=1 Tax=Pseudarthrobacter sp. NIBRBAC000502772 TaxID=2590775 RepID=UPI0011319A80|nr:enoyl-CoA hydratase/isomerase family protein [Pseudarthrobacter sp. NIBRBAC000502772]QDG66713.1 enoyl-CoA hydratase/isomerase family protein [Pseudarthrobacter sp. NIBRBAC000502772]
MSNYRYLNTWVEGGVGVLQLNHPEKRNALGWELHDEIINALAAWAYDDEVASVLLIGSEEIFCAGWRLDVLNGITGEDQRRFTELATRLMTDLSNYRKPTVAGVAGVAPGYGMDLANMCDITIAAENAFFGSTQVKYGMNGFYGGLMRKAGPMRARRLFFTGDPIDAAEAYRIGLADEVVPVGGLIARSLEVAKQVAEMGSEMAVVLKEVALHATNMDHVAGIAYELRVTHDLTQRSLFHQRTPDGLSRLKKGESRATERVRHESDNVVKTG